MASKKKKTVKKTKASKKKPEPPKESGKPKPMTKVEPFLRELTCELTDEEWGEVAKLAAEALAKHDSKVEEQKAAAEHAKAVIKDYAAELRRLSQQVRERSVRRPVACERTFDYEQRSVTDKRTDTGEVIYQRPMTDAESQVDLPFRDIDDDFDDAAEPGEGIGDPAPSAPKSAPKTKKPKADKPEPETKPDGEFHDPGVDGDESNDDEKPDAAE